MSDHTPTTEQVRAAWASFREASQHPGSEKWMFPFEQFDRWLTQHDAEVAAKALREAADASPADTIGWALVPAWLRRRADEIGADR